VQFDGQGALANGDFENGHIYSHAATLQSRGEVTASEGQARKDRCSRLGERETLERIGLRHRAGCKETKQALDAITPTQREQTLIISDILTKLGNVAKPYAKVIKAAK
jgi:hypothetical protein